MSFPTSPFAACPLPNGRARGAGLGGGWFAGLGQAVQAPIDETEGGMTQMRRCRRPAAAQSITGRPAGKRGEPSGPEVRPGLRLALHPGCIALQGSDGPDPPLPKRDDGIIARLRVCRIGGGLSPLPFRGCACKTADFVTPSAQVAELVDALVSGTSAARRGGSSPLLGTTACTPLAGSWRPA